MAQRFETALIITGDGTGASRAIRLTREQLEQLSRVGRVTQSDMRELNNQTRQVASTFDQVRSAIGQTALYTGAALGLAAVASALMGIYTAGNKVVGLKASLTASFGMSSVAGELDYVRKVAGDLGLEMLSLGDAYSKWAASAKGTSLEGQQQKAIFEAVAQSSRVLNLSVEDTEGTLRALSQMISKGKVQAEELRGQLGERLPGAFQMAARAMGVTTAELDKMLQDGKVLATDLLPKLAVELNRAYGGDARAMAVQSLAAETNRLKNAATELSLVIYDITSPTLANWARNTTTALTGLSQHAGLLLVPITMLGTYLSGKALIALSGYTTATYTKIVADRASILADKQRAASAAALALQEAEALKVAEVAAARKAHLAAAAAAVDARRLIVAREVAKAELIAARGTDAYSAALVRLKAAQASSVAASAAVTAARTQAAAASTAAAAATGAVATQQASAAAATAALSARWTAGAAAARVFGGALALIGGPLGLLVLTVGGLAYGLTQLANKQAYEGKSIKDLEGNYIAYHDITRKVVDLNAEYLNASEERKKSIKEETDLIAKNTLAEIDALKTRIQSTKNTLAGVDDKGNKLARNLQTIDAEYAAPEVIDGQLVETVKLTDIYKKQLTSLNEELAKLEQQQANVLTTQKANNENTLVATENLKGQTKATQDSTQALADQGKQFGLTKEQQDALTESYKRALSVISSHENSLKSLVENLQKQRIEIEHGSVAAKYYEDRLNGLSDAESRAAAGSDQYNNFLKERNRLQAEAAGLSGGLLDEYNSKLKELGLDESALDFSGIVDQTDAAVAAADNYKNALQGAEDIGKNLGETISKNMEEAAKAMVGVDHGFRVALGKMATTQETSIKQQLGSTLAEMRSQMAKHAQELSTISKVAAQTGIDPTLMKTMAWIESRFNGAANRGEKSAKGLYQFVPGTASDYGIRGSELNIEANTRAYVELLKDNMGQLRKFGIEINGANLYLAHQMGAEGLRQIKAEAAGTGRMSAEVRSNMLHNKPDNMSGSSAQAFLSAWQDKYAKFEAGIKHLTGAQGSLTVETHKTAAALQSGAVASQQTNQSAQAQLAAVKYLGAMDDKRVTAADVLALRTQHMANESNKLVKAANDQVNATQQSGYELRQNQLIQQQFNAEAQNEILTRESMADYLAEERNIRLQMASIRDPNAAYKAELAEKRLTDTQKQALMDQRAALEGEKVIKGLEDQALALQQNGQEQYATQLKAQGLSGAYLEQAKALNYSNTVVSIRKGLDLELKNTGLDEYQQYYNELIEQGIAANDAYTFSQQKQLIAFGNLKKELEDEYKLIGLNNIQKYEAQKLIEGMSAAHAKEAAALYQRNRIAEATTAANDAFYLAQQAIGKTDEQLRALALTQSEGYPQSVADSIAATEKQTSSLEKYRTTMQDLTKQRLILEARLQGGDKAARAVELGFEYANKEQRIGIQTAEEYNKKLEETVKIAQSIGDELADALLSGDWGKAGDNILNILKSALFDPIKKNLSAAISSAFSGQGGSFNLGSIFSSLGSGGSGGIFSSITAVVSKGLGSLGTALSGGLGGIMSGIGSFVSAIPGWGWAIAGVAALSKIFGKKDGNLVFGQGMTQGQQLTGQGGHNGQEHYRQTALGLIGATSGSNKIGREAGFVPEFHKALDVMQALDELIAKSLPGSVDKIKSSLSGLEVKGFSIAEIMKQRYGTVLQALPAVLKKALTAGKNIADMSAEEIVARFKLIEEATQSGLVPALDSMKWAAGHSKEKVLALAIGLSDAAGGMDALKTKLDAYYQAAYTESEREVMGRQQARKILNDYNKQLGLSGDQYIDSIAKLRARIEAEDKTTAAGQKNIATLLNMVEALKTLSGTAEEAAAKLKQQWSDYRAAAFTDAEREAIAKNQAQKLVDQFNKTYGTALSNIIDARQLMRTIDTTSEAGKKMQQALLGLTGSLVTLGGTAQQIKEKIAALTSDIKNLVSNLYSPGAGAGADTSNATQTAAQSALDAAETALESLRSRYDDEKARIDDLNQAAQDAYREELARYEQLKQLAVDLREYIAGFKRSNELLTPLQKLQEVQSQYNSTLALAKTGDADAAKNIQGLADELRQSYLDVYASSKPSQDKIAQILADLTGLAGVLDGLAGSTPNQPSSIGSTTLASLEQQIAAQQATISSLQTAVNNANSAANATNTAADRAAMAKELATKIGELGLATDKSAWDILAKNGINISNLAADFGINVKQLDATFIRKTADLADRLNVNSLDLLTRLNVNFSDLAAKFGIDISKLTTGTLGKLDTLADQLKVSSVDLASKLGINIDKLGDLMANKLAALPNIPADIKAGLAPHLQDIRNAADPATLQKELRELQAYVNSLPPGIKEKLNDQLQGILGYTSDTKTNTADTKTETLALRSIRSAVDNTSAHTADLTAYTRDQVNAKGIQLALQNARALNQNAASIGKSAIPSFAVGTANLPHDMLANIHRGEMIFTAAQGADARDMVLHNQRVIPQIADYLSEIAANDNQAPVFIQPLMNYQPLRSGDSGDSEKTQKEMLAELRELRKEVASLRAERNSSSQVVIAQGDELIRQGDASLSEQQAARRDARLNAKLKVANGG